MTVRFVEIAELELDEAVAWYSAQAPGLGDAILIERSTVGNRDNASAPDLSGP